MEKYLILIVHVKNIYYRDVDVPFFAQVFLLKNKM